MPKAWSAATSTDINDYEALEAREFYGPQFNEDKDSDDEVIIVTDTLCHQLQHIPRGNITSPDHLQIRTAIEGGGTLLTCTESTAALTSGVVRVQQRSGKLEFHADQEGQTLYATYKFRVSNFCSDLWAQLYNRQRTLEGQAGVAAESYEAGENVVAGPGYISANKVYQSNPAALTTCGYAWILADTTSGNTATTLTRGDVIPRRAMPANTPIYAGHGGDVTWEGDSEVSAMLGDEEYRHSIGISYDGITLKLNTLTDPRRQ